MKDAHVDFVHHRVSVSDAMLSECGSRYLSRKEAGRKLRKWIIEQKTLPVYRTQFRFAASLLTCANEVFPEAALADPVADLEIWEEWRSGLRQFPHPGIYARLNIFGQERKTSATSSVGVLGEILTGLLCQSYIAPLVAVRPIRRWPDFILLGGDERYSFVESKASTALDEKRSCSISNVDATRFEEGLVDAVQELNAEPLLHVWLSFCDVTSVDPLEANVCMVELDAPENRKAGHTPRMPQAVVEGLAQRIAQMAVADLELEFPELQDEEPSRIAFGQDMPSASETQPARPPRPRTVASAKRAANSLQSRLRDEAMRRAEVVLPTAVPKALLQEAREKVMERIGKISSKKLTTKLVDGRRLAAVKRAAVEGRLTPLRECSAGGLLMLADLPTELLTELQHSWSPDWETANQPWGDIGNLELWRCSSAVLALGGEQFEGQSVHEARRQPPMKRQD